ncbi:MAG: hypothetical protein AAFV07_21660, partial [Bacteroidota bacterium]
EAVPVSIQVRDIQGRMVLQQQLTGRPGQNELMLNLHDQAAGMYQCVLRTPGNHAALKVQKF